MTTGWDLAGSLLTGRLREAAAPWPLTLTAVLCDLRPRFLPKGTVGGGCRAVARNGRVLLCGDRPLAELAGQTACVRLQTWNRAVLPGDAPQPHGVLLCVRVERAAGFTPAVSAETAGVNPAARPDLVYQARLATAAEDADLALDVGGLQVLAFFRR